MSIIHRNSVSSKLRSKLLRERDRIRELAIPIARPGLVQNCPNPMLTDCRESFRDRITALSRVLQRKRKTGLTLPISAKNWNGLRPRSGSIEESTPGSQMIR